MKQQAVKKHEATPLAGFIGFPLFSGLRRGEAIDTGCQSQYFTIHVFFLGLSR
jgi:hypothetical protein